MSINDISRYLQQLCYMKISFIFVDDKVTGITNTLVISLEDNKNKNAFSFQIKCYILL